MTPLLLLVAVVAAGSPPILCHNIAEAGGPYDAECEGALTSVKLDGSLSRRCDGSLPRLHWESGCPGATFDDTTIARPTLTVGGPPPCPVVCEIRLQAFEDDGTPGDVDYTTLTVHDTEPPVVTGVALRRVPNGHRVECGTEADRCGTEPILLGAVIRALSHERQGDTCIAREDRAVVACGELVRLRAVKDACRATAPRSPRPAVSVDSHGVKTFTAEEFRLRVSAKDGCGNASAGVEVGPTK